MELSVVIPSWNTRELLRACLKTVREADKPETEVIVVDNGSADGSADMVAEEFPEVRLERNAANEGFAKGCNQGMRLARGRWILLLNADTEVAPDALQLLIGFLESHSEYGAVAPGLFNADGSVQRSCMRFPRLSTALFFSTPLERWWPKSPELRRYFMRDWNHSGERDIDQPPAACLLVRRAALDEVGLFDEELWLFFNDVDLSLRLARAGWRTRFLPAARVLHHVGKSTSQFGRMHVEWQRNRLHYYRKHHGRLAGLWIKACVSWSFLDWSATNAWNKLRGRGGDPWAPMRGAYAEFMTS